MRILNKHYKRLITPKNILKTHLQILPLQCKCPDDRALVLSHPQNFRYRQCSSDLSGKQGPELSFLFKNISFFLVTKLFLVCSYLPGSSVPRGTGSCCTRPRSVALPTGCRFRAGMVRWWPFRFWLGSSGREGRSWLISGSPLWPRRKNILGYFYLYDYLKSERFITLFIINFLKRLRERNVNFM